MAASRLADKSGLEPKTPTVLVVEGEVLIRFMIADELRSSGLSVVEAANADEALTILRSSAPVDLIFTDIRMPGSLDGLALAALVRTTHLELRIIIASGHSPVWPSRDIADAFFSKPYDPVGVVSQIKKLLVTKNDFLRFPFRTDRHCGNRSRCRGRDSHTNGDLRIPA